MSNPQHTVVVGCLVRGADERVLLVRHPKRGWEIPQGRVEEGESLHAAAHREILEEAGVTMELGPLAAVHSKVSPPPAVIFTFLARHRDGEPSAGDGCLDAGWFPAAEALEVVTNPVNHDRLLALLGYAGKVVYRSYSPNPFTIHTDTFL
jgi:8-oxo-dGTP diphosphatase